MLPDLENVKLFALTIPQRKQMYVCACMCVRECILIWSRHILLMLEVLLEVNLYFEWFSGACAGVLT